MRLFTLFLFFISSIYAHTLGDVLQESRIYLKNQNLVIEYNSRYGENILPLIEAGFDRESITTKSQEFDRLKLIKNLVEPKLIIKFNDKRVRPNSYPIKLSQGLNGFGKGMFTSIVFTFDISSMPKGVHSFSIFDSNFKVEESQNLNYFINPSNLNIKNISTLRDGRELKFDIIQDRDILGDKSDILYQVQKEKSEVENLKEFLIEDNLSLSMIVLALVTSFILGAIHSLSPGHGKAMVSSYLIGSKGTLRDAILLGIIVTFTHTFSVILLGLFTLWLSEYILPQKILPWLGFLSGVMIFLIGYLLLAKRAISHHHHHHNHCEERITLKSLISLGFAGGIVPCPSALVVLLISISLNKIFFGLGMIIAFSIGLASVLILIGILSVRASKFIDKFSEKRVWIQRLPILSAGFTIIIGVLVAFSSLIEGSIITINL